MIFRFLSNIFLSLVVSIGLWILFFFLGRLINGVDMTIFRHIGMFIFVFIPTVLLLSVFFLCLKTKKTITKTVDDITAVLANDFSNPEDYTNNARTIANQLALGFVELIKMKLPIIGRFIKPVWLVEKTNAVALISNVLKKGNEIVPEQIRETIKMVIDNFASRFIMKVNTVQRISLVMIVLSQTIGILIVFV